MSERVNAALEVTKGLRANYLDESGSPAMRIKGVVPLAVEVVRQ